MKTIIQDGKLTLVEDINFSIGKGAQELSQELFKLRSSLGGMWEKKLNPKIQAKLLEARTILTAVNKEFRDVTNIEKSLAADRQIRESRQAEISKAKALVEKDRNQPVVAGLGVFDNVSSELSLGIRLATKTKLSIRRASETIFQFPKTRTRVKKLVAAVEKVKRLVKEAIQIEKQVK